MVLAVASLGALLAFVDSTIVNVAFPSIQRSFPTASLAKLSWVLNGYNIVLAALLILAGRAADLLGLKRMFIAGIAVFTVGSAACAAAASPGMLIGFRLVQGFGAALLIPASLGLAVHGVPAERRSHAVGLWGATAALAAALGPPIGGALVSAGGWRWAFVVNVPFGVVAVLVARRVLVESRAAGRRRLPDLRGALLLGAALALLTLAIVQGGSWGWTSPGVLAALAGAALAATGFVASSRAHPAPMVDPKLLRIRAFVVANTATVVLAAGWYAYMLNHILWLRYVWGYSLLAAGFAVAPGAVMAAVTAAVLGRFAERVGYRRIAVAGALVWAAALAWWYPTQVGIHPDFLRTWLPGQLITGVGVGATLPTLAEAALHGVPGRRYATASAVNASGRQLGAVLGVALLVVIVGVPHGPSLVGALRDGWRFSGACFLLGALIAVGTRVARVREEDGGTGSEPAILVPAQREQTTPRAPETRPLALAGLVDAGTVIDVPAGEWLFRQGDPADGMYLVRAGRLQLVADGRPSRLLGTGELIGELALLTAGQRSAGVRAVRDSRLAFIPAADFQRAMVADPATLLRVASSLADRLASMAPPTTPNAPPRVVAVTGTNAGASAVAGALTRSLRDHSTAALLGGPVTTDGLHRAEREHEFVVLDAGADDAEWQAFCLRNADRTVVVVDASAPDPPEQVGPELTGGHLVWADLDPSADQVRAWFDAVQPLTSHRVAVADPEPGLQPLADRLAQRCAGLVLAGGGARALAHLGVLEVLEQAGVRFERAAGTSFGALVAAGVGLGLQASQIDAYLYEEFVRRHPLGDVAPVPRRGLVRGHRAEAGLRRTFGEVLIEQLPREFCCVSVDLLGRQAVVHRRGPLWEALAASTRLPVMMPPLGLHGTLHVDGTVMDNLPVAALAERSEGPIVAVDIGLGGDRPAGGSLRIPTIGETLLRTLLLAGDEARSAARARADVVIAPRSAGVGLLEWHQIDAAKDAGRRAAEAALPAVLAAVHPPRRSRVTGPAPRQVPATAEPGRPSP